MQRKSEFVTIPKADFDQFLRRWVHSELLPHEYKFDWEEGGARWNKVDTEIKEYCYRIPLAPGYCIKLYSSVDRRTNKSREIKKDAIRVVAARDTDLKPIRGAFPHVKRLSTWPTNLTQRIREVLQSVDSRNDMKCICKKHRVLRGNLTKKVNFIGCSDFSNEKQEHSKPSSISVTFHGAKN